LASKNISVGEIAGQAGGSPLVLRKKMAVMGAELDAALAKNIRQMSELVEEFKKEFPPCVGFTGYLLVGVFCRKQKERCRLCPHSLVWRRFDYTHRATKKAEPGKLGKAVFLWARTKRLTSLPVQYLRSRGKSAPRFKYYNETMKKLNEQRKKLTAGLYAVQSAYRSLKVSKVFRDKAP
jgi:hypothetical protein